MKCNTSCCRSRTRKRPLPIVRIGRSSSDQEKSDFASNNDLPRFGRQLEDDVIKQIVSLLQFMYNDQQGGKRDDENYSSLPKFGRQVRSNMEVPKFGREINHEDQTPLHSDQMRSEKQLSDNWQQIGLLPLLRFTNDIVTTQDDGEDEEKGTEWRPLDQAEPVDDVDDSEVKRQNPLLRFGKRQSPLVRFGKRTVLKGLKSPPKSKRQAPNILRFG